MGHGYLLLLMVVYADRSCCARHLRAQLLHTVGGAHEVLGLLEDFLEHLWHVVGAEALIPNDELGQGLLHELRHVVALLTVTVENSVNRDGVHLQNKPRVLIRGLRLQTLAAGVAKTFGRWVDFISNLLEGLVGERGLP